MKQLTDSERLSLLLEYLMISANQLSLKLGLNSNTRIYNVLTGKNGISSKLGNLICSKFTNISYEWIVIGKGSMLINNSEQIIHESNNIQHNVLSPLEIMNINIPGNVGDQFTYIMRGTSMCPVYKQGDMLGCRIVDKSSIIEWGRNYFVQTLNGNIIRKLLPGPNHEIILQSNSPENFPDVEITREDILKLAIIIGCVKYE